MLQAEDDWPAYAWVDDFIDDATHHLGSERMLLEGLLIWGDGSPQSSQWVEPCRARLELTKNQLSFKIDVGDATMGLQQVLYGSARPRRWGDVNNIGDWIFRFRSFWRSG
jgi:hypothetical protein